MGTIYWEWAFDWLIEVLNVSAYFEKLPKIIFAINVEKYVANTCMFELKILVSEMKVLKFNSLKAIHVSFPAL